MGYGMNAKDIYNKNYYSDGYPVDYHDKVFWEPLFKNLAQRIFEDLRPERVLDVGCAFGYIVEYLHDLGVEAWGIDVSEYAISCARQDIKPYLRVASAFEPLPADMPQSYDLVLNIEVLEHIYEEDSLKALARLCTYGDRIFFSSSADAIYDPTHFNVQQPEYWAEKFAEQGFYKNLQYNTDYISKFSAVFEKNADVNKGRIVRVYEHTMRLIKYKLDEGLAELAKERVEREQGRTHNNTLVTDLQLVREDLHNQYTRAENASAEREVFYEESSRFKIENAYLNGEVGRLNNELSLMRGSRGYRLLQKYYRTREKLLPKGSTRRKFVKYCINKLRNKKNVANGAVNFYTPEEQARQNWCRDNEIPCDVKFSIVVPVYKTPISTLEAMVMSVKNQIYTNWELCIADASPDKSYIRKSIKRLSEDCSNIKYLPLKENKGISENTKAAIAISDGDFIALLDHDDIIAPNALYEYALWLCDNPETDFFYSDKDTINEEGTLRVNTLYKPGFSPEIMLSANYMTHFCVVRKSVLDQTAGFEKELDGAQDWDIFLKIMEQTTKIKHIDEVLYHWRISKTSVASGLAAKPYATEAQLKSVNNYIKTKGWKGEAIFPYKYRFVLKINWKFKENPSVGVIIFSNSGDKSVDLSGVKETVLLKKESLNLKEQIAAIDADVLIFIDGDECISVNNDTVNDLAMWAMHPEIAYVAPQLRHNNIIKSCGLVYEDALVMDMFTERPVGFCGQMGGAEWYRNFSFFRSTCVAVEKSKWVEFGDYRPEFGAFGITYHCLEMLEKGYRNVYNYCVWAETTEELTSLEKLSLDFANIRRDFPVVEKDPYFNKRCTSDVNKDKSHQTYSGGGRTPANIDKYSSDAMILADIYDFTTNDLDKNKKVVENVYNGKVKTIIWFLQEFEYIFYAGIYTIFRTADYLRKKHGVKNTFVFLSTVELSVIMDRIRLGFPELADCDARIVTSADDMFNMGNYDASICTFWTTAYYAMKFNNVKRKFYFIQDYEPLFYPACSTFAQTESTYRFGFYGIANTEGLKSVYEKEYKGKAVSLDPSVDTSIFYPAENRDYNKKPYMVFFYGRPGHLRNGFELGVKALKQLKERMGKNVRIVTAGANYDVRDYGLEGIIENLGRLQIEETGDLYRKCDAGLIMMHTRHPSYLPYEMMACGCCVVSNYNPYTSWFLRNGENSIVCEPSASNISEMIEGILCDIEKRKAISERASKQILENNPDWDTSLEKVVKFINNPEQGD